MHAMHVDAAAIAACAAAYAVSRCQLDAARMRFAPYLPSLAARPHDPADDRRPPPKHDIQPERRRQMPGKKHTPNFGPGSMVPPTVTVPSGANRMRPWIRSEDPA